MAATFIAIVIPTIKNLPILISVIVALVASVLFSYWKVEGSLIIASILAMISGYLAEVKLSKSGVKPVINNEVE